MRLGTKVLSLCCAGLAVALTPTLGQAQSDPAALTASAVHINRTPNQSWPGYGIYLGNGLILTAAHVAGDVAQTKPHVVIAGQDLPATLVKQGSLDSVDLTLLSIDGTKLPVGLQMRRTPLCDHPPIAGERVVVAIPEGTAPSKILPRQAIPADLRGRFDTAIADVATTGNSGSGVFDAGRSVPLGHHEPQDFGQFEPIEQWARRLGRSISQSISSRRRRLKPSFPRTCRFRSGQRRRNA